MKILAHRANILGPDPSIENTPEACLKALQHGFGLEIDLRKEGNNYYISHDPQPWHSDLDLGVYAKLFTQYPTLPIAVNVKELGYEADLIALQKQGVFGKESFYFDFELLEPTQPGSAQRILAALPGGAATRMASRCSDRGESVAQCLSIPGQVVWADEFDSLWLQESDIRALHEAGRQVYAISPELHGFNEAERLQRWADFKAWGVDGLCTDFSLAAKEFFA